MKKLKWTHWITPMLGSSTLIIYFIAESQFFALRWVELALAAIPVFLIFTTTFISSIVFWSTRKGQYSGAYWPFRIHLLAIIVVWFVPSSSFSKRYPEKTEFIGNYNSDGHLTNLYKENYLVSVGTVGGSDRHAAYLTDSINFRIYLGDYSDFGEHIDLQLKGDSVIITNPEVNDYGAGAAGIVKQHRYNIMELQQRGVLQ